MTDRPSDLVVVDRTGGAPDVLRATVEDYGDPVISDDGTTVGFPVPGPMDLSTMPLRGAAVWHRARGRVELVSIGEDGGATRWGTMPVALSGDGRHVAFVTEEPLVASDANGVRDVYVRVGPGLCMIGCAA